MRKRLTSKMLAVILTLAICASTVLGCLMSVSAATPCYSFGTAKFPSATDLSEATVDVTFQHADLPNGMVAGLFEWTEVGKDDADYLILKEVTAKTTGVNVNVEDEENLILFDSTEAKNPVVLTFVFEFSNGNASKNKTYYIQLNNIELAYNNNVYYEQTGLATGSISAECEHVVSVVGAPVATDEANGYAVYENSICTLCGETFGKQLVPSADALGEETASNVNPTIKWDGTKVAPTEGTGTEADPYIISEVSHLAYITEAGPDYTHGKFFKVKDGIKNIVLQKAADANTLINIKSAEEAKTYLSSLSGRSRWNTGKYDAASAFCGTFDGNGATIYGLSTDTSVNVSLFGSIGVNAEFKNLSIKNTFIQTGWYAATLAHVTVGYTLADGTAVAKGTVKVHDCTFAQNYINPQSGVDPGTTGNQCIAVILGQTGSSANGSGLSLKNILTYDNITFYEKTQTNISPLIGSLYNPPAPDAETETEYCEVMDCIFLDVTSHLMAAVNNNLISYKNAQSVYSDSYWIKDWIDSGWYNKEGLDAKTVSKAEMLGTSALTAAPNLAWGTEWLLGAAGELPSRVDVGFVSDTIYWDGSNTKTAPTVGSGTKDDPYIINTVAELAYISGQSRDNYGITDGKFYKIADGIKNIVMQPYVYANDIMALNNAAEVKAYFETNAANLKQWFHYGWEGSTFCGNIDFNGATVYGIYQVSTDNAGLFSNIDAGAVFSNLAIKNSYMKSESSGKNYQVGAIGAVTNGETYGKAVKGIIWAKNITVANNYMYDNVVSTANNDRAGVLFGAASDAIYIDNALVYGNNATYGDGATMPIISTASNSADEDTAVPEGLVINYGGKHGTTGKLLHNNMVRNSIILGAYPVDYSQDKGSRFNDPNCFQNVYTDADISNKTFANKAVLGAKDEQIKTINPDNATGTAAKVEMPNLTWGTDWYLGATGEQPVLAAFVEKVGASSTSTGSFKLYGANTTYNDDGSFDFNLHYIPPYAGFTPTLYVGTLDGSKFMKLTATASSLRADLGANALMFTIPNLSARDINKVWLPTLVTEGAALVEWGLSKQIALGDYSKAILEGNYSSADKAVAAATINYATASENALSITTPDYNPGTIDLLEFGQYLIDDFGSTSQWYDTKLADNGETGTKDDPIIIDTAEEFVYLAKASGNDTKGKYYEVADGIAGFDLSRGNLDFDGTLEENLAAIQAGGKNHAGGTPGFQGHFDGKGITVYGAWTNHNSVSPYAGLFSCTFNEVSIKNVHVKLASFTAQYAAGGIIGYHNADELCTVTVENCSVTESHFEVTTSGYGRGIGGIIGYGNSAPALREANDKVDYNGDGDMTDTIYRNVNYNVKNCFVELDEDYFTSVGEGTSVAGQQVNHGGVIGGLASNAGMVSECIVIGITPYATSISNSDNSVQHSGLSSHFANVYTTDDVAIKDIYIGGTLAKQDYTGKIIPLTKDQLTGISAKDNMPALNWDAIWTTTLSGYPTFIANGYEAPSSGRVISYTGSSATIEAVEPTTGSGTKDDPIIINTVQEFAWVVGQTAANVAKTQKYFKVADGISSIVLQKPEYAAEIMALGSAAETKAYFEANASKMVKWQNYGWEGSTFAGHFDGNGATVYGLYQTSTNNAGLFSTVEAGSTIQNIGVKNSYITSSAGNYQVAAIAAVGNGNDYALKQEGVIWINGCTVANNYMYNSCTSYVRSGVVAGAFQYDVVMVDNCLVYGNDATYGSGVGMAVYGDGNNDVETTKLMPTELTSYVENSGFVCNSVRNSIILGCDAMNTASGRSYRKNGPNCFVNVYTDGASGTVTFSNGEFTYTETSIKAISADSIKGADAQTIVDKFNETKIGDVTWHLGAVGDMPGHKEAGSMPSAFQTALDSIQLDTIDTVGDGVERYTSGAMKFGMYQTSLTLKANPYMSFTFAFGGEYQINRDKIQVRFTYTQDGTQKTLVTTPPACELDENGKPVAIKNINGWTNNTPAAGRYHTYRATGIPVEALAYGIKVEASYDGGEWLDFGTYSVEGFGVQLEVASKSQPCDYYTTRVEAVKALLFYAQSIAARYGK